VLIIDELSSMTSWHHHHRQQQQQQQDLLLANNETGRQTDLVMRFDPTPAQT